MSPEKSSSRPTFTWQSTIHDNLPIFKIPEFRDIMANALHFASGRKWIRLISFNIYDDNVVAVWSKGSVKLKSESVSTAIRKFTAHEILREMRLSNPELLPYFKVKESSRKHRIWSAYVSFRENERYDHKISRFTLKSISHL